LSNQQKVAIGYTEIKFLRKIFAGIAVCWILALIMSPDREGIDFLVHRYRFDLG